MRVERRIALAGTATAVSLAVGGCTTSGDTRANTPPPQDSVREPAAESVELVRISVRRVPKLGSVVVDESGHTLYRFDEDGNEPSRSSCVDECAQTWPPVKAGDKTVVTGLDPQLVGAVRRADGIDQLTLKGWPLYRFRKDTERGATRGHGVNGLWWAAQPDGGKALALSPSPAPSWGVKPAMLEATEDKLLGPIVVDEAGRKLYRYDADQPKAPESKSSKNSKSSKAAETSVSRCLKECAALWPPVRYTERVTLKGVDRRQIGSVERPDGIRQLTLNGWPLYRYVKDVPGEANGHGVKDAWYVSTPTGQPAKEVGSNLSYGGTDGYDVFTSGHGAG